MKKLPAKTPLFIRCLTIEVDPDNPNRYKMKGVIVGTRKPTPKEKKSAAAWGVDERARLRETLSRKYSQDKDVGV